MGYAPLGCWTEAGLASSASCVCTAAIALRSATPPAVREPAWHRRRRAQRAAARTLLRVQRASSLLAAHHSAQVVMPGAGNKDGSVLSGPKKPAWSCGCGCAGNWASRTSCRDCGRGAPRSILDRARAADKAARAAPGSSGSQKGERKRSAGAASQRGRSSRGGASTAETWRAEALKEGFVPPGQAADLRRQLDEAKKAARAKAARAEVDGDAMDETAAEEGDSEPSVEEIQREILVLESLSDLDGSLAPVVAARRARLAEVRGKRRAALPAWRAMRDLQQRAAKKEKAIEAARHRQAEIRSEIEELQAEGRESAASELALARELSELRREMGVVSGRRAGDGDCEGAMAEVSSLLARLGLPPDGQVGQAIGVLLASALVQPGGAAAPTPRVQPPPQVEVHDLTEEPTQQAAQPQPGAAATAAPAPGAVRRVGGANAGAPGGSGARGRRRSPSPAGGRRATSGRSRSGGSADSLDEPLTPSAAAGSRSLLDMGIRRLPGGCGSGPAEPIFQLGLQPAAGAGPAAAVTGAEA